MHIRISLCIKFHFEQTILNVWTEFPQERYPWSKPEKLNIITELRLFKLALAQNFSFNWQFSFFWPDFSKKCFSGLKQKKWTSHIFYIILHIQISLLRNFSSNWQFLFFESNLAKRYFLSKTEKGDHHHGILHFRTSLNYKISMWTDNFKFLDQIYPKKGISCWKQNKQFKGYKRLLFV